MALGEAQRAAGRMTGARETFALVDGQLRLLATQGENTDTERASSRLITAPMPNVRSTSCAAAGAQRPAFTPPTRWVGRSRAQAIPRRAWLGPARR